MQSRNGLNLIQNMTVHPRMKKLKKMKTNNLVISEDDNGISVIITE